MVHGLGRQGTARGGHRGLQPSYRFEPISISRDEAAGSAEWATVSTGYMGSCRSLDGDIDRIGGSRPWILAAERTGSRGLNVGGGNRHADMLAIDIIRRARRAIPEHGSSGQEAAACNGDVYIAAAGSDGIVVGAAKRWRWIAGRLCRKYKWPADQEDLRRGGARRG